MDLRIGFIFLTFLHQNVGELQTRLLMIISEGSSQQVGQLWSSQGNYNDAAGTRQSLSLAEAFKFGDYRSSDIDQWSTNGPKMFSVGGYNGKGTPMWYMTFDYPSISQSTYRESWPVNISRPDVSIFWGTKIMSMASAVSNSNKWFHHFHNATGAITVLSKTGTAEPLTTAPTNPFFYNGCYQYSSIFNREHAGTDTNWMTWNLCSQMCQTRGKTHMAITARSDCHCGNLGTAVQKLGESQCLYSCPGNNVQKCGGTNGIYTVFSLSAPTPTYNSNQMISNSYSVGSFTIPHTTKISASQLSAGVQIIYLSEVEVSLSSGSLTYNIYYSADENVCSLAQSPADMTSYSVNGAITNFTTSSTKQKLATTPFRCIWIDFPNQFTQAGSSSAYTSVLTFYHSVDVLLTAPFFVILGHYDVTTTPGQETTITTNQPETTTISPSQSVTDTTSPTQSVTDTTSPTQSVTDTTGPTQSVTDTTSPTQSVTDTTSPTQSVTDTTSPTQSVTDTTSPTQSVTDTTSPTQSVTDTTSPTQSVTDTTSPTQSVTDTTGPTQSVTGTLSNIQIGSQSTAAETSATFSPGLTSGQSTFLAMFSTTSSSIVDRQTCPCRCSVYAPLAKYQNMTTEELEEALKEEIIQLKRSLTVPKENLSATIRKKTSARDLRPSAKSMGALGITLLCLTIGILILFDCLSFGGKIVGFLTKNK